MTTRPLVFSPLQTPTPSSFSQILLLRRLQALTRALASSSPQPMASSPPPKKVLVPIANGTEPMEAVITIDVLRRAGADVAVTSVEPGAAQVAASWGVKLVTDALLADLADTDFDLISLPVSHLPTRFPCTSHLFVILSGCFGNGSEVGLSVIGGFGPSVHIHNK